MIKVLVVEDNPLMLKTIEMKLKKDGYETICCSDGKTALEKLASEMPDIVLTDIMLPYVSGLEIITVVKAMEKKIPVIIFSSLGQEDVVEEAFSLGADDYITKPLSLTELAIRISRSLKRIV
jgi:DNA-binding response OmpR family regulator